MPLTNITRIARSQGDPRIISKGPSSLTGSDRLARGLGWFSVGLGIAELTAAGQIARMLGLTGKEGLIRAYGARELMSAVPTLSVDKSVGLASRIGGDVLDIGTLASALHPGNPKRGNAAFAMALVVGVTLLDVLAFAGTQTAHRRARGMQRGLFRSQWLAAGYASLAWTGSQGLRDAAGLSGAGNSRGVRAEARLLASRITSTGRRAGTRHPTPRKRGS